MQTLAVHGTLIVERVVFSITHFLSGHNFTVSGAVTVKVAKASSFWRIRIFSANWNVLAITEFILTHYTGHRTWLSTLAQAWFCTKEREKEKYVRNRSPLELQTTSLLISNEVDRNWQDLVPNMHFPVELSKSSPVGHRVSLVPSLQTFSATEQSSMVGTNWDSTKSRGHEAKNWHSLVSMEHSGGMRDSINMHDGSEIRCFKLVKLKQVDL